MKSSKVKDATISKMKFAIHITLPKLDLKVLFHFSEIGLCILTKKVQIEDEIDYL